MKNNYWPHYGIDFNCFQNIKKMLLNFKIFQKNYKQYDWGIIENFYIAISDALELEKINLYKNCNVIKFDNDFQAFEENRNSQS